MEGNMSNVEQHSDEIFEKLKSINEDGKEFCYARDLQGILDYKKWSNFKNVIEKSKQVINNGFAYGKIDSCKRSVSIGSGAIRGIVDYRLDINATGLIRRLSYNKLKKLEFVRNETIIFSLVEKYCKAKNIEFVFQYELDKFRYDCLVGNKMLIEFDEQHHLEGRQLANDEKKNHIAKKHGFTIYRFNIYHDIVDMIIAIEEHMKK
jgi:hypothetical protein